MAKRNVRYVYTVPFFRNFFYAVICGVNTYQRKRFQLPHDYFAKRGVGK